MHLLHEAAAGVSRAAGLAVTRDLGWPSRTRSHPTGLLLPGRNLLQPRPGVPAGHVTGLNLEVTPVAFRTAVLAVAAAHGLGGGKRTPSSKCSELLKRRSPRTDLRERAAGPLARRRFAAGGASGTRRVLVALLAPRLRGQRRHLFHPAEGGTIPRLAVAGLSLQVTDGVAGAAVDVIGAAHSLEHRRVQTQIGRQFSKKERRAVWPRPPRHYLCQRATSPASF